MPYQYVREPLTAEESDCLANSCGTTNERLVLWALLDSGVRVSALSGLTAKSVFWPQPPLRVMPGPGPMGRFHAQDGMPSHRPGSRP